ncbi:MAG: hypothetical protein GY710_09920 [Desulfobacteraceae bacterium]|nr:hypothetical protein [Desulfobacteraceae bacterium]
MQFFKLSDTIGAGTTDNEKYRMLNQFLPCIMVGVTGVGKTTLKKKLLEKYPFYPLPGRRTLTDRIILPLMQQKNGTKGPVHDRFQRFTYTKAFRNLHPGGMGYLLSQLKIKTISPSTPVLFDGLRGLDELRYAVQTIPSAFFIVLIAPDHLRVKRLLNRQDPFDHTKDDTAPLTPAEFNKIVPLDQKKALFDHVHKLGLSKALLYEKIRIVTKEKESYDQETTRRFLMENVPDRTFSIDSSQHSPGEIIAAIHNRLENFFISHNP